MGYNNNLQNKMIEQTCHEMLSTVINELLRPLLAVLTSHVRLHKKDILTTTEFNDIFHLN